MVRPYRPSVAQMLAEKLRHRVARSLIVEAQIVRRVGENDHFARERANDNDLQNRWPPRSIPLGIVHPAVRYCWKYLPKTMLSCPPYFFQLAALG